MEVGVVDRVSSMNTHQNGQNQNPDLEKHQNANTENFHGAAARRERVRKTDEFPLDPAADSPGTYRKALTTYPKPLPDIFKWCPACISYGPLRQCGAQHAILPQDDQ